MRNRGASAVAASLSVGLFAILCGGPAEGAELPPDVAERIRENQRSLIQYSWTMRIQIEDAGQALGSTTERLQFGKQGYVEREMLGDDRKKAALRPEMIALVERIVNILVPYVAPNPDGASRFLAEADVQKEGDGLRVRGAGFVNPEDTMDLIVGKEPMRAIRMAVVTTLEDLPLRLRAEYEQLPAGPNHVARITADYKDLRIVIDNTDYKKIR